MTLLIRPGREGKDAGARWPADLAMTRKLRTAHVSTPASFRGGENQALVLMRGLMARGHEAFLFTPPGSELSRRAREAGVEVVEVKLGSELNPFAAGRLAKVMKRARPDTVQFHDSHAVTLGGIAARSAGVRARVATRRIDYRLKSAWKWSRFADLVIAISQAVKEIIVRDGVPAEKVRVVHSAVSAGRLEGRDAERARKAIGLTGEERVLVCPAAFTSQKGHEFLIDAMPRVREKVPEVLLLLAGKGKLEGAMRERAGKLGLVPDHVRFLGWREDVPDLLAASDLFVVASRFEGLCSSALDAMWCGVPVVTTDAGGLPEAVGDAGRMVPVGEVEALAEAIVLALDDREGSLRLARAARERVERLFSVDSLVEGTLAVYSELTDELVDPPGAG